MEEIKRRAQSGGKWPQVGGLACVLCGFILKGMNVGVRGEIEPWGPELGFPGDTVFHIIFDKCKSKNVLIYQVFLVLAF